MGGGCLTICDSSANFGRSLALFFLFEFLWHNNDQATTLPKKPNPHRFS